MPFCIAALLPFSFLALTNSDELPWQAQMMVRCDILSVRHHDILLQLSGYISGIFAGTRTLPTAWAVAWYHFRWRRASWPASTRLESWQLFFDLVGSLPLGCVGFLGLERTQRRHLCWSDGPSSDDFLGRHSLTGRHDSHGALLVCWSFGIWHRFVGLERDHSGDALAGLASRWLMTSLEGSGALLSLGPLSKCPVSATRTC